MFQGIACAVLPFRTETACYEENSIDEITALSDEDLVVRFQARAGTSPDRSSIDALFQRYHSRIATWCLRFTGDREAALDLAQEVLLKAYRHLDGFQGDSKFSTWLYSIARNHCLNHLKTSSREPVDRARDVVPELPDPNAMDAESNLAREASLREMRRLMAENLDETETLVMRLHYADEMPLGSITRALGLTNASGAKAYIVSAKRKLNTAIERLRAKERLGR